MANSTLGPCVSATIVTPDLGRSTSAYRDFLHHHVHSSGRIRPEEAQQWDLPALAQARVNWLANDLDEPWLRLIESPDAGVPDPFHHSGWFSLEISVKDVDALRPGLDESPFRVLGEPANLDVSDDIRAMQLLGPAGELLYLTQVDAAVPPFELPFARCSVDRLFIPVMLTPDRDRTLTEFERFPGTSGLKFETRITVINRARKLNLDQRHPVATIQLKGKNLVEIDQLDGLKPRPAKPGHLPTGIAMVSFAVESIPAKLGCYEVLEGQFAGHRAALARGSGGELIELVETDSFKL